MVNRRESPLPYRNQKTRFDGRTDPIAVKGAPGWRDHRRRADALGGRQRHPGLGNGRRQQRLVLRGRHGLPPALPTPSPISLVSALGTKTLRWQMLAAVEIDPDASGMLPAMGGAGPPQPPKDQKSPILLK